jgi:hypothetical protein
MIILNFLFLKCNLNIQLNYFRKKNLKQNEFLSQKFLFN